MTDAERSRLLDITDKLDDIRISLKGLATLLALAYTDPATPPEVWTVVELLRANVDRVADVRGAVRELRTGSRE